MDVSSQHIDRNVLQGLASFYDRKKEWEKQAEVFVQLVNLFKKRLAQF